MFPGRKRSKEELRSPANHVLHVQRDDPIMEKKIQISTSLITVQYENAKTVN
jgi:hypothetical protein